MNFLDIIARENEKNRKALLSELEEAQLKMDSNLPANIQAIYTEKVILLKRMLVN